MEISRLRVSYRSKKLISPSNLKIKKVSSSISNTKAESSKRIKFSFPSTTQSPTSRNFNSTYLSITNNDLFHKPIFDKFKVNSSLDKGIHNNPSFFDTPMNSKQGKVKHSRSIVKMNKDMRIYMPNEVNEQIRKRSASRATNIVVARTAKNILVRMKKETMEFKLEEKFRRFFFRHKHPVFSIKEVSKMYKAWSFVILGCSISFIIKNSIEKKKYRKYRIKYLLRHFSLLLLFIGKMLLKLQVIKKRLAMKKIRSIVKYCYLWLIKRKKNHKKILSTFLDITLNRNCFKYIVLLWKSKIVFIQKNIKEALRNRKIMYRKLLEMWRDEEYHMANSSFSKKKTIRDSIMEIDALQNFSFLSKDKRLSYIKRRIKDIIKSYSLKIKNYKASLKMMSNDLINLSWYNSALVKWRKLKPEKPNIIELFTTNVFKELINQALDDKKNNTSK
ncbi:hypothetical protein SteCoe_31893 [Stentor coeruleus]|uniref:Uncharacterized protein n=1 Tax=Stentor coeruleus TaxID=5963 RepID=A0A1R2B071_9CILI|nr:hypothetical protein SteCoe_31893 [Stentor coeruleus]